MSESQPHIVVLGGGFGGAYAARSLTKKLKGRARVTIVNVDNFLLFTPLLPEAASGTLQPRHIVVPLRRMCKGADLVVGRATEIDTQRRTVRVRRAGELSDAVLAYDHLIVSIGGVPRLAPVPGLADVAVGMKSLAEAIWLRNHVIDMLEQAEAEPESGLWRELLTFVVVGGGYAGVETLAEVEDMTRAALKFYPTLEQSDLRWVLIDAGPSILFELGGGLGDYAQRLLEKRGVEVLNSTTISEVGEHHIVLSSGQRIDTRTLVWTAGVAPNPLVKQVGAVDERGRLIVDEYLRVPGLENVWAVGDCAAVPNAADGGRPCPPTSQHALRQAWTLARNVNAAIRGYEGRPFTHKSKGGLATLGLRRGVAQILGLRLRGFPAWFAARTYHLMAMPTFGRRVRVALDWTLQLFGSRDIVQLKQLGNPERLDRPPADQ